MYFTKIQLKLMKIVALILGAVLGGLSAQLYYVTKDRNALKREYRSLSNQLEWYERKSSFINPLSRWNL